MQTHLWWRARGLWGCTCTSHLNKDFPCFSDNKDRQHLNEDQEEEALFVVINIFICAILCRQESRETLPLQLPLYSLSLSLTLNIKTHDLSPNLSPPCIYFSCKQLYYTLAVSNYTILIVKLYNCVCTGRVPDPTSLFLPTSFCM